LLSKSSRHQQTGILSFERRIKEEGTRLQLDRGRLRAAHATCVAAVKAQKFTD